MPKNKRSDDPAEKEPIRKRLRSNSVRSEEDAAAEAPAQATTGNEEEAIGFTLKLADGEEIQVSKSDSQQIQDSCAFFRNAFRHGTLECRDRIISKPDWSMDTATAILQLVQNQTMPIPTDYAAFKEAADQILLPIRVLHPVSGTNMSNDSTQVQSIADTCKAAPTSFTMNMKSWNTRRRNNTLHPIWEDLLTAGTVFVDHAHCGLQVQLIPENPALAPVAAPADTLSVGSFAPLTLSVYHTCARLSESLRNPRVRRDAASHNKPACMALPLYYGGKELMQQEFPNKEFLLIETDNVPTVHMTRVTSTTTDLREVLQAASDWIAPVHLRKLCYLLIPEPSIQMMGKLITACQKCQDDPGTIGWDLEKNQFCTLKTLRDTKAILEALVNPETKMAQSGSLQLVNVDMTAAPVWASY